MGELVGINNAIMYKGVLKDSDFNKALDQGIYHSNGSGVNAPVNYAGLILVYRTPAQITQIFITNVVGSDIFIRTFKAEQVDSSKWYKWSITSIL